MDHDWQKIPAWAASEGPLKDVILSSRLRLSRNLQGFAFSPKLSREEERLIQRRICRVLESASKNTCLSLEELDPRSRSLLGERGLLDISFAFEHSKALYLAPDENNWATINMGDHLQLVAIRAGLDLSQALSSLQEWEKQLDGHLDFSAREGWGYLGPDPEMSGSALRASVLLHLPAWNRIRGEEELARYLHREGLGLRSQGSRESAAPTDIYQVHSLHCVGRDADNLVRNLESAVLRLRTEELRLRDQWEENHGRELRDMVARAYGVVYYSQVMSQEEAGSFLSLLRWGLGAGWIQGLGYGDLDALRYELGGAQIRMTAASEEEEDSLRSALLRDRFRKGVHLNV